MKKFLAQKKVHERNLKDLQKVPNRKEREEIEELKNKLIKS